MSALLTLLRAAGVALPQTVVVNFGNVTVRNGPEFPARTVTETNVQIALPAGQVPATIIVKSGANGTGANLDVALIDATGNVVAPEWRSMTLP